MPNTLTGGYDICVELDRTLLTALAAPLVFADPRLRRPELPVTVGPVNGELTLIVTGAPVEVAPGAEPALRVTLRFEESALRVDSPRTDSVGDLEGYIALTVPVGLGPTETAADGTLARPLMLDFAGTRDITVWFRESSTRALQSLARRLNTDGPQFVRGIDEAVRAVASAVRLFGQREVGARFTIAPGDEDGSLNPLTFVDVALSTTQTSGPFAERFLVVLGTLLRSHAGRGDPVDKQEVALGRSDDATVIVSPPAFRDLVLAPQLLRSLLPIHLDRHLRDDFLARLPRGALTPFTDGLSGQALTDRRRRLAQLTRDEDNKGFFDLVLPRPLPRNALTALGPQIGAALPAELRALLRDTRDAVRLLLPRSCGDADYFYIDYAKIERIAVSFGEGRIRISGHVLPDVTGLTGHLDFSTDVTVAIDGTEVVPTATAPTIESSIDLEWWVYALLPLLAGFLYVIEEAIHSFARREMRETLENALKDVDGVTVSLPLGAVLRAVDIEPRGLVVRANATAFRPEVDLPELTIGVAASAPAFRDLPVEKRMVNNGCVRGVFEVTPRQVQRRYQFTATTEAIPAPRFEWFVNDDRVEGVGVRRDRDGDAVLRYDARGNSLDVRNEWGAPTMNTAVRVRAIGTDGTTAEGRAGAYFEATREIWPPEYTEATRDCLQHHLADLEQLLAVGPNRPWLESLVEDIAKGTPGRRGPLDDPLVLTGVLQASQVAGLKAPAWLAENAVALERLRRPPRLPAFNRPPPG